MRLIYMYNLSKSILIYYNQFAVLLHSVRTTLKISSFQAAFFTSIPLYTLFKIKTAFNFLTFAKKGFIWGYNRRSHFIFQTAYHLC